MTSKAILTCRQNSHPFQERILTLEQPVKIGRSLARSRSAANNAIFDCKVLSRNHALFWYNNGKFYLQDTKSSNGTFVNSQRLSKSGEESTPREVYSGDIVQFGVDVLENARKVNHGCIIANIKLFLPDGSEAKSSIPPSISSLPPGSHSVEDLYQLNQYIQEAIQREQMLEEKLATLQTALETICKAAEQGWKALIMEDKLLSRVENLESQLQVYSKDYTEDKLREEVRKLHEDKEQYQSVAKERLNKVLEDKNESVKKYQEIKRSLVGVEAEHANMCIQMLKSHGDIQDLAQKYSAQVAKNELIQIKCQELEDHYRDTVQKLESRNQELEQQLEKCNVNKKDSDSEESIKVSPPIIELEINPKNSIDLIMDDEEEEAAKNYKYQPHLNDDVQLKLVSQLQEITEKLALNEQNNKNEDEDLGDYDSSESIITCTNDADQEKELLNMQLEEAQLKAEQHKLMADELSSTVKNLKMELDLKNSLWDNRVKDELNSAKMEILRLEKVVSSQQEEIKLFENDKKNIIADEGIKPNGIGEPGNNVINDLKNRISELQEKLITVETRYMECHEERTVLNRQLKALQLDHQALFYKLSKGGSSNQEYLNLNEDLQAMCYLDLLVNSLFSMMASKKDVPFISDIDNKLKSSCPNVQLKEVPAINQKRLVAFINHFTINMVDYLNKFAQTCQQRLFQCDEKLRRMEDELSLLEAKLNSIPETKGGEIPQASSSETKPVTKEVNNSTDDSLSENSDNVPKSSSTTEDVSTSSSGGASVPTSEESSPETLGVDITKYLKMLQFGVPPPAVKLKMQQEGYDPQLLDKR